MKVIEDYIDSLDDEILFEGDDGGLRNILSKLRRVKLNSSEKKDAEKQLKEIESTQRFKNVKASIIKYTKNPTRMSLNKNWAILLRLKLGQLYQSLLLWDLWHQEKLKSCL